MFSGPPCSHISEASDRRLVKLLEGSFYQVSLAAPWLPHARGPRGIRPALQMSEPGSCRGQSRPFSLPTLSLLEGRHGFSWVVAPVNAVDRQEDSQEGDWGCGCLGNS